jgi:hypothetical protein
MVNTLSLDDDLGDAKLVRSLESAFDLKMPRDLSHVSNVGQLFDVLFLQFSSVDQGRKCATAMAFYRLRSALYEMKNERLPPSFQLNLVQDISVKRLFGRLSQKTNLKLPNRALTAIGNSGGALIVVAFMAILPLYILGDQNIIDMHWLWAIPVGIAAGAAVIKFDPGRLPSDCQTLGDLVRKTATLNYGRLAKQGAKATEEDIWREFREIVSQQSGVAPKDIQRDTVFFRKQLRAA